MVCIITLMQYHVKQSFAIDQADALTAITRNDTVEGFGIGEEDT